MNEPIHETENLALYKTKSGFEIHLQGNTHAVLVGNPKNEESGRKFMERIENPIGMRNLRKMYGLEIPNKL
jgi:hypothetical protein